MMWYNRDSQYFIEEETGDEDTIYLALPTIVHVEFTIEKRTTMNIMVNIIPRVRPHTNTRKADRDMILPSLQKFKLLGRGNAVYEYDVGKENRNGYHA